MIGISPAWFLSTHGEGFTCAQAIEDLDHVKNLGFSAWQPEIYRPERLAEWTEGKATALMHKSLELNLQPSQFVAHFLLHGFNSTASICSQWGIDESLRLMDALEPWPQIQTITIPLPPIALPGPLTATEYRSVEEALLRKLRAVAATVEETGRRCAVEIMPGSLVGGSDGFRRLQAAEGLGNLGANLDTGHFHAANEPLALTLSRLSGSVTGTHLCDNDALNNLSGVPGEGTVEWDQFRAWAQDCPYDGSWDIEIRCSPEEVLAKYRKGYEFVKQLLEAEEG